MKEIYQVLNSYHLLEGLDSEFLIIADSEEEAKEECLRLLTEDQDSHIETIKENIASLEKALNKDWGTGSGAAAAFMERANQRNKENIINFQRLLGQFNGYKKDCLSVRKISPRLKDGHIQYI